MFVEVSAKKKKKSYRMDAWNSPVILHTLILMDIYFFSAFLEHKYSKCIHTSSIHSLFNIRMLNAGHMQGIHRIGRVLALALCSVCTH